MKARLSINLFCDKFSAKQIEGGIMQNNIKIIYIYIYFYDPRYSVPEGDV